jgi:phosphatidate cytidylyltransferase
MLATRVASALVFGPVLIAAGYFGGPLMWLLTGAVIILGLLELDRLFACGGRRAPPVLTVPFGLAMATAAAARRPDLLPPLFTLALLVAVSAPAVAPGRLKAADGVASVFGVAYVGWLASHFILLRDLPGGAAPFFVALVGTWVFDSASYFAGRAFGRRKLVPATSPSKTVEGLVGGLMAGLLTVGWLASWWLKVGPGGAAVLAVVVVTAAQLGDLAESALKRGAGLKDSGKLIPGHGGVLDRFDSLLWVMPAVYYLLRGWLGVSG